MEDLDKFLFYIVVMLVIAGFKAGTAWLGKHLHKNSDSNPAPEEELEPEDESKEESSEASQQSLQDLIRKFREEQAKTLPEETVEDESDDDEEIPEEIPEAPVLEERRDVLEDFEEVPDAVSEQPRMSAWEAHLQKLSAESEEQKAESVEAPDVSLFEIAEPTVPTVRGRPRLDFSKREARKGFLWAQVLDNPRFRRRSPLPLRNR